MDKQFLIDFESGIKEVYEAGQITAPIHLSGGNEDELIKIFEDVNEDDWVFSSWRNHYHALLHGIKPDELANMIVRGKSMSLYSEKPKFYSSSIVGGIIPIAVGTAKAQKLNDSKNKTWCFVGDMTFESGIFYEAHKYARNHNLPLQFVVEDNGLSTNTPTNKTWGGSRDIPEDIIYYKYERGYPHHGTGNWILF
jgi:pyruvate dehydrogenase E1 component alpha subunit|tara:strand:+ start:99 stop:683 length:585 start_codon:yes stop_codon:yes gene_type:complete